MKNIVFYSVKVFTLLFCLLFFEISSFANKQNKNLLVIKNVSQTENIKVNETKIIYKPEWCSIARHSTPEWFRDAKFGIYTSFGPAVVGTQYHTTEWYAWAMYQDSVTHYWNYGIREKKPSNVYLMHKKRYGDPNKFGYKDFVKLFQPKKFDADEWAQLFEDAGAKFCGPLAVHHDNYLMWDSKLSRWNSKKQCGIDFCGELEKAIKKRHMKYLMTFHHSFTWWYFTPSFKFDGGKPGNEDLYGRPHAFSTDPNSFAPYPDSAYEDLWYNKLNEACVKYDPDLVWFDMGLELLSQHIREKAFARIFNLAEQRNKDVGLCYKIKFHECIPAKAGILDYEKGRSTGMRELPWVTDTSLGGWYYNGRKSRSPRAVIEMLVDIVSKNGCLLLDVSPKPDGTIPEDQVKTLHEIGKWLKVYGEGIYNTRPWVVSGEGPTQLKKDGHFNENWEAIYTNKDIRFTRSKDNKVIYVFVMNIPSSKKVIVNKLGRCYSYLDKEIKNVTLINSDYKVKWKRKFDKMELSFPIKNVPEGPIFCYKINLK